MQREAGRNFHSLLFVSSSSLFMFISHRFMPPHPRARMNQSRCEGRGVAGPTPPSCRTDGEEYEHTRRCRGHEGRPSGGVMGPLLISSGKSADYNKHTKTENIPKDTRTVKRKLWRLE